MWRKQPDGLLVGVGSTLFGEDMWNGRKKRRELKRREMGLGSISCKEIELDQMNTEPEE